MLGSTRDDHEINLTQTQAALEGGVTGLSIETALQIIEHWHAEVLEQDDLDLGNVAEGLAELRDLLQADALDGPAIGDVLVRLGEGTQAAALSADDERLTPMLERLATVLSMAGNALVGATARSSAADPHQGLD